MTPTKRALMLAVLLTVVHVLCGCAGARQEKASRGTFRVMTYNIHHGEGLDRKVDLERIAELIKEQRADIVALQEVDKGVERTGRRNLPAELAKLTGMVCVFSNNFHFQGGEYGNAVLTRYPVISWTNLHYRMLRQGEQRGLLQVQVSVEGRPVQFWNTHVDFRADDSERLQNIEELQRLAGQNTGSPIVVCGDFNDVPGSRTHQRMSKSFSDSWELAGNADGFTYSADNPLKRIDYIWISKRGSLKPLKAWVPQTTASDHLPVVCEFGF